MAYNPKWNVLNRIYDSDTRIAVIDDAPNSRALVEIDGSQVGDFRSGGLQLATGTRVSEFSTDGTLIGDSDTAIPTEKAVKTYVDAAVGGLDQTKIYQDNSYVQVVDDGTAAGYVTIVADGTEVGRYTEESQRLGTTSNFVAMDATAGITVVPEGSVEAMTIDENGLQLFSTGATVNEFSTDGTLADDSDTAVPTEAAVKTYVDTIAASQQYRIYLDDSYVQIVDDGTANGYAEVVIDGTQVQYWDSQATSIRMGKASGAGRITVTDTAITGSVGASDYLSINSGTQIFGLSTDTFLRTVQGTNSIAAFAGAVQILDLTDTTQVMGRVVDTSISLNESTDTVAMTAAGTTIFSSTDTVQTFGVSGDTYLTMNQSGTFDVYANNTQIVDFSDTLQQIGVTGGEAITVAQSTDSITFAIAGVNVSSWTGTQINLGLTNDTYININQSTDTVELKAGNQSQILVETTGTTVYDDLTVTGDLFVDGTTWVVHNQEVTTSDNLIVINNGEVGAGVTAGYAGFEVDRGTLTDYQFLFYENTDTFRIGEIGSLQAVATREDTPGDTRVPWWNATNFKFETLGDTYMTIDTTSEVITFAVGASTVGTFEADGLTLASGTNINEFSTDGTLAGDSDNAVPTEQAVKTYVDAQIGGSADKIWEDDSYVEVVDDGTNAGYVTIVTDGVEVAHFDAEASTQRIGKASGAGRVTVTDTTVTSSVAATEMLNLNATDCTFGDTAGGHFYGTAGGLARVEVGATVVFNATSNLQRMGVVGDTSIDLTQSGNQFSVNAGGTTIFEGQDTFQRVGVNGDTNIYVDQAANTITIITGGSTMGTWSLTNGLTLFSGASVSEFSVDGTLAGDSDDAVPTEQAVKTYVDTQIANLNPDKIWEDDSYVEVVDDGTNAGYVEIVTDGVQVGYWDASGTSQRMGKASGAGRVTVTDSDVTMHVASTEVMSLTASGLQLGGSGARVTTISTDSNLGTSDTTLVTQNVVKTYVDTEITTLRNQLDLINVQYVYSDTTAVSGDVLLVDTTAGDVNIELIESSDGKVVVKKVTGDSNSVIISTTPGTIDGQASFTIDTKYQSYHFVSDGTDFFIL